MVKHLVLNGNAAHSRTSELIAIQRDNLGVSWAVVLDRLLTKVLTVFLQFGGSSTAEPTKSNSSCDVSDSSSNSTQSNVHNHNSQAAGTVATMNCCCVFGLRLYTKLIAVIFYFGIVASFDQVFSERLTEGQSF